MNKLIQQLNILMRLIVAQFNQSTTASNQIYIKAKSKLETDASPRNLAPNTLSCAESTSTIVQLTDPRVPIITGTYSWYIYLKNSSLFIPVKIPLPGDIVNYPTGLGNGSIPNGHTGIVGDNNKIYSSNPASNPPGIFDDRWTVITLQEYLGGRGGFPCYYYRKII
jgi:hypothetical protein